MLTLPAHVLRDLLAGTALAATRDLTLPALHAVHLRWDVPTSDRRTTLVVEATDRYRVHEGSVAVDAAEGATAGEALVDLRDVEALVKALPKAPSRRSTLPPSLATLAVDGDALDVSVDGAVDGGEQFRLPLVAAEFPRIGSLWPADDRRGAVDAVTFTPRFVGDLAKIPVGPGGYWRWSFTYDRFDRISVTVATPAPGCGHDVIAWRCAVMPVRLADERGDSKAGAA